MGRVRRFFLPGVLLLAAYFAVFGGEYSLRELREARASEERERAELEDLRRQIDSLYTWAEALEVDSATLERIARERFGMIRRGETLYIFAEPVAAEPVDSVPAEPR